MVNLDLLLFVHANDNDIYQGYHYSEECVHD
jgi:hypothetical protein